MRGQSVTRHADDVADSEKVTTAEEYADMEEGAVAVADVTDDLTYESDEDAVEVNLALCEPASIASYSVIVEVAPVACCWPNCCFMLLLELVLCTIVSEEVRMDGRNATLCAGGRYCWDACGCCRCFSFDGCIDDERNVDPKNCINDSRGLC